MEFVIDLKKNNFLEVMILKGETEGEDWLDYDQEKVRVNFESRILLSKENKGGSSCGRLWG